jgi:lysophospholipase L1-like esterase
MAGGENRDHRAALEFRADIFRLSELLRPYKPMASIEIPSDTEASRYAFLARLTKSIVGLVLVIAVVDVVLRFAVPATGLDRQRVDIQSPSTLYVKLEALRQFKGTKIVVLGDSLIFGRAMRDKGDKDWQEHTLSSQLQRDLTEKYPDRPVMVSNLGMNGTLPADLEQLVRIVTPLKPDLIIFDLSLRSFSRDFGSDGDATRNWLSDLRISPNGHYAATSSRAGLEALIRDQMVNHWYFYRIRDLLQTLLFGGQPVTLFTGARNAIDDWFKTGAKAKTDRGQGDLDDIVLLMRSRSRYANIDLAADNPQRQALDRLLQRLSTEDQAAIIFYATENPQLLPQLLPPPKFEDLQRQLAEIITPATSARRVFVGPLSIFSPGNFIDHVHLNRNGYERLSRELGRRANEVLGLSGHS